MVTLTGRKNAACKIWYVSSVHIRRRLAEMGSLSAVSGFQAPLTPLEVDGCHGRRDLKTPPVAVTESSGWIAVGGEDGAEEIAEQDVGGRGVVESADADGAVPGTRLR